MGTEMPTKESGLQHQKNSDPLIREPYWFAKKPESDEEKGSSLGHIFGVFRRRMAVIVFVALLAAAGSAAMSATRTSKYEGRFQMLVEPLKTSDSELLKLLSETLKQNVNDLTRQATTTLDYQALLEVLKSPKLMNPIIQELQAKYPEISYDTLIGNDPKASSGQDGRLYVNRIIKGKDESRVIEVRYQDSNPDKIQFVLDKVSLGYRKYSIDQQQTNLRQGIKFVDQQIPNLRLRVNSFQGQLQSFQQKYNLFNPELQGEQLVKRVDELQATQIETLQKLSEAKSLYTSLQNQLGMQQNAAIASSALSESPQYQQILNRIREVEAKIATESVRWTEESEVMRSLRQQRAQLIPLLNQEGRLAVGNNIAPSDVNSQIGVYQNSVRRNLIQQLANSANQVKSLEASLQTTNSAITQFNQQIQIYPAIARQYTNLQRELQVSTDTLNQLLSRQEALRVDAAQQEVPWELIMPPTLPRDKTGKPITSPPSIARDAVLGGVAGILLGLLVAFALEKLQNVFHDPEEVKSVSKIPLLGSIPFHRELKKRYLLSDVNISEKENPIELASSSKYREYRESAFSEAFCSLYTRIQSLNSETPIRTLVVTSASHGDGKSTVAVHLAQIAAEAGKRVLLVDADLCHPQVHQQLGLVNTKGLSEILSQGLDLNDALGQSPREENLFVVTAGEIVQNPAKLFSSPRMQAFLERSQANFDLVVFDTPHLLGRLDTNVLATHVDGIMLVVGIGKTLRPSLKQVLQESKTSRFSVLGMVANTLEP
jgi:capsular exopolysaccharide synthesis family protein